MKPLNFTALRRRNGRGVSLIIVLIMLIIIGITASTAMRSANSEQRATNNQRMASVAQQYAEAGLRFCESQLKKADGARESTLQSGSIPNSTDSAPAWKVVTNWTGGSVNGRATVPTTDISNTDTVAPAKSPECFIETLTDSATGAVAKVITARGFSPNYTGDSGGKTTNGTVVWLQSIIQ